MENEIEKKLDRMAAEGLSDLERDRLWARIRARIQNPTPIRQHVFFYHAKRPMLQLALIIILIFGGSVGTVAASDGAGPGDLLYPIDRAVENVQLAFSSDENKAHLKMRFALERVEEVEDAVAESAEEESASEDGTADENGDESGEDAANDDGSDDGNADEEDGSSDDTEDGDQADDTSSEDADDGDDGDDPDEEDADDTDGDTDEEDADDGSEEDGSDEDGGSSDSGESRVEKAYSEALAFIGQLREDLAAQGDEDAVAALDLMLARLDGQVDSLPASIRAKLKEKKDGFRFDLKARDDYGHQKIDIDLRDDEMTVDIKTHEIPENGSLHKNRDKTEGNSEGPGTVGSGNPDRDDRNDRGKKKGR